VWTIVRFVGVVALIGVVTLLGGFVSLKASTGHWSITESGLRFAMQRSVATWSMGVDVPDLTHEMAPVGAAHFDRWCRSCHGVPGDWQTRMGKLMLPPAPGLGHMDDAKHAFFVVKHGLRFTGMPAWPTQVRDDEVWRVTAFVLASGDTTAETWAEWTRPAPRPASAPDDPILAGCAVCHGWDGRARSGGFVPALGGQREAYLRASLDAYAASERASGFMQPVAAALSPDERARVAAWFAGRDALRSDAVVLTADSPPDRTAPPDPMQHVEDRTDDSWARGRRIAVHGLPRQRIPACTSCHGDGGAQAHEAWPRLAGQSEVFLVTQLELLREGVRGGADFEGLMTSVANHQLGDVEIRAVAGFYAHPDGD